MAILVACQCGKRFKAGEQFAGKRVRCPGCGQPLTIPTATRPAEIPVAEEEVFQPTPAAAASKPPATKGIPSAASVPPQSKRNRQTAPVAAPTFTLSPKVILLIVLVILVPSAIFWAKEGPMKAAARWQQISSRADDNIVGQITRAIETKYKEAGFDVTDIKAPHKATGLFFDEPVMMLRLPDSVHFQGKSTEGDFRGEFHPKAWRFEADTTILGEKRTVTGSANENDMSLEIDGTPVKN